MRTHLRTSLAVLILIAARCSAQIPNGGFESWSSVGAYQDPDGWTTENSITWPAGQVLSCARGMPGVEGSSYAKVATLSLPGLGVLPGSLFTGTTEQPGFPYDQRPPSLDGEWQYHMQNGDVCLILVNLTHWNTGLGYRDVIGTGQWFGSGVLPAWQPFSMPINYSSGLDPDTAFIQIASSYGAASDGSTLWVDALAFATTTGMAERPSGAGVVLRPAFADDRITITAHGPIAGVDLLDMSGRELDHQAAKGDPLTMDVAQLPAGIWLARVFLADGRSAVCPFVKN